MYSEHDRIDQPLYVVTALFNPVRYESRWRHFADFAKRMKDAGAELYVGEATLGERAHTLTEKDLPGVHLVQFRVRDASECWLKENLLNLVTQRLPSTARYVAFVDADVQFARADIVSATLHALQHYPVVQMFSTALDMSPEHEPLSAHRSFGYNVIHGVGSASSGEVSAYGKIGDAQVYHPGFAWAWRLEALSTVGGLLDRATTGPADHHMAWGLLGRADETIPKGVTQAYRDMVMTWQQHASALQANVGYVDGTLLHGWHGRKVKRGYFSRWRIVIDNQYDPRIDVKSDSQGVLQLAGKKPRLRDELRAYFRSRDEDSAEVPAADYRIVAPKPAWPPKS